MHTTPRNLLYGGYEGEPVKKFAVAFGSYSETLDDVDYGADTILVDDHIGGEDPSLDEQTLIEKELAARLAGDTLILDYADYNPITDELSKVKIGSARWQTLQTIVEFEELVPHVTKAPLKNAVFNFSINKMRPNRKFLLEELSDLPGIDDIPHTYSLCSLSNVGRYSNKSYVSDSTNVSSICYNNTNEPNAIIYQHYLKDEVFEPSIISFITEPMMYQNSTFYSEKTLFAFEGFTIPIWVGGYKIPEYLRSMGFDMFDDIVDHFYSLHVNPVTRMKRALLLNKHLFNDFDKLNNFYADNIDRFWHNYKLNRDLKFQRDFVIRQMAEQGIAKQEIKLAMDMFVDNYTQANWKDPTSVVYKHNWANQPY